jgi:hypothetical protein
MSLDKVQPLKLEDTSTGGDEVDQFPTGLDPLEDFIECRGNVLTTATVRDEKVVLDRTDDDMTFRDGANPVPVTLSELIGGGSADFSKLILTVTGTTVYIGDGDFVLKV